MGRVPAEPEQLRRDIAQTRAELGETVEELAARADVKERVPDAAGEVREHVHTAMDTVAYQMGRGRETVATVLGPRAWTAIAAVAVGVVALLIVRKSRRRR